MKVTVKTNNKTGEIIHTCDDWKPVTLCDSEFIVLMYKSGNKLYYPIACIESIFITKQ